MHRLSPWASHGVIEIWTCRDCGRSVAITWPNAKWVGQAREFNAEVLFKGDTVCLPDGGNDYDPQPQGRPGGR